LRKDFLVKHTDSAEARWESRRFFV